MRTLLIALALVSGLVSGASAQPAAQPSASTPPTPTATGQAPVPAPSPEVAPEAGLTEPPATAAVQDRATAGAADAAAPTKAPAPGAAAAAPTKAPAPAAKCPVMPERTDLKDRSYWMPPAASTQTDNVDVLFYGITALSIFSFIAVTIVTLYFAWRYRARKGHRAEHSSSHNDVMEITWTIIPSIILVVIFIVGWKGFLDLNTPPKHALEIKVTAEKWNWSFTYPNGVIDANLHVPVGQPVRLIMRSKDVLHSLWVPSFRIKQDVIPNRYTKLWFQGTEPGIFRLYCTEYCGTGHSKMKHLVQVHEAGGYEKWLEQTEECNNNLPPVELGKKMYDTRGCAQCHSIDGTAKTGPTWKGLFGTQRPLADGSSVTVDENYIRESILEPKAKVAAGFAPVMPTFKGQLKDNQIDGLVEYIKSLK
jgi:cytochrome c oxidase subunit 2